MLRSIYNNDNDDCLNIETVVCKIYFPPSKGEDGNRALMWPTSSCQNQQNNQEIRRIHIENNKSFDQFFEMVASAIVEPSTDIELLVQDADSDWIPVYSDEQWNAVLNNVQSLANKKQRQLRVKVTGRNGSSVTPKPSSCTKKEKF